MNTSDPELALQLFIGFKYKRIKEIGKTEYYNNRYRYDAIIEEEYKKFMIKNGHKEQKKDKTLV